MACNRIHGSLLVIGPTHTLAWGDGQHITQPPLFESLAQFAVVAINLIGSCLVTGCVSLQRTPYHASHQLGLGDKLGLFWNCGNATTLMIGSPFFRRVQLTIYQRGAIVTGVAKKHANLTVLDASSRAGVLALDPNRMLTLLHKARLIGDQHGIQTTQLFQHVIAKLIASSICIPTSPVQQMRLAIRSGLSHPLDQLAAVLPLTVARKPSR